MGNNYLTITAIKNFETEKTKFSPLTLIIKRSDRQVIFKRTFLFVSTKVSLISTVTVERFYSRVRLFPSQHDDFAKLLLLLLFLLRLFSRPCSLSFRVSTITDCFIRLQSAGIAGTAPTIANRFDWHETARSAVPTDSPVFRPRFRGAFFDGHPDKRLHSIDTIQV